MSQKDRSAYESDTLEFTEDTNSLQIGNLFAYIEGDASPEIANLVEGTAEYRQQAAEMKQMSEAISTLFADAKLIDRLDLVDVASGQATANQRLIVAAHCRRDPAVTAELEELQEYWREMTGEGEQSATESSWLTGLLPDFPAKRLWSGANARTNADSIRAKQTSPQTYESTDLTALVTLQFILTEDEVWRLEGDVLQDDQPAKSIEVMLVPEGAYANPALTDEIGTFFFDRLEEGNYSLRIMLPQGVMVISDIELTNDEL